MRRRRRRRTAPKLIISLVPVAPLAGVGEAVGLTIIGSLHRLVVSWTDPDPSERDVVTGLPRAKRLQARHRLLPE